jgi:hypothetical protein
MQESDVFVTRNEDAIRAKNFAARGNAFFSCRTRAEIRVQRLLDLIVRQIDRFKRPTDFRPAELLGNRPKFDRYLLFGGISAEFAPLSSSHL